jgi:ribosomal protein S18 acetylase RimI-like enzyme
VWIAHAEGAVAGFVVIRLHADDRMGEISMIAVDSGVQRQGIGTALIGHALAWMKEQGMAVAMVETGGDPGHAPARQAYEKNGFTLLPIARYFKRL